MGFLLLYERTTRILPEIADGQLNLFNEAEVEAKKNAPEPCIEVPAHQRRKKQKDHTAELLAKFPHEECLITLPEEERVCKRCGTALTSMGKEKIRTEIEFIPAKVKVIDYYRESFQCLAYRKEAHPIRLYEYQPGRSGSYAKDFLKGFNGILQTDGYTRKYLAMRMPSAGHMQGGTSSRPFRQICRKKTCSAASAKKPSSGSTSSLPSTKGLQNSRKKSAKNSVCERAIRNFTIGRKNWLFSDSPKGAKASAAVYSIIETAKANGLNPFQYLKYLFEHLPNADIQRHPEPLDDVLPWNETIQQNCK